MAVLVVRNGPLAGRRVEVTGELVIGRGSVDLSIDDAQMSRRHAVIRAREGTLEVEDLGSLNGTRVNGVRIHGQATLAPGDLVEVGDTEILVESAAVASDVTVVRPAPDATVARPRPAPAGQPAPPRPDAPAAPTPAPPAAATPAPPPAPAAATPAPPPAPAAATPAPPAAATPAPPAAAAERLPAPPAAAPAASQPPPSAPFGILATGPRVQGRRRIATREIGPMVAALVVIAATAIALILYFAGVFVDRTR
jgi:predicted component of type VI protein secretion system